MHEGGIFYLRKRNWIKTECNGCKSYNPERRIDACSIYPYQKQKKTEVKKVEINDTG